ncbi:MAG: glycoside hydrolase family 3 protein [Bacillota bacterium]
MSKKRKYTSIILVVAVLLFGLWLAMKGSGKDRPYFCDDQAVACDLSKAPYHDKDLPIEERVEDLLSRMTLSEKIGQLALVERSAINEQEDDILKYNLGAVLSGGGSHPDDNTPAGWQAMTARYQAIAGKTRLQIPLLYGVDAVHGHAIIPGATVFPHQIALAATGEENLVRKVYAATAEEMLASGVNWNFAPSVDVVKDLRWGRTYETFGNNSERVSRMGKEAVIGLQGNDKEKPVLLATAKHYLGAGAMVWNSADNEGYRIDQGEVRLSEAELRAEHLPAFREAIAAGVGSVMAGLNSWQGTKISANRYLLTSVLKEELGFQGFVVSDWFGVYELPGNDYQNTAEAINAGIDMVMLPYDYPKFAADMEQAVMSGRLPVERLDDAVRRILRLKFSLGLFEKKSPLISDLGTIGSPAHRALAREAVRKSLVILKGEKHLPLRKSGRILVAGSAADNTGRQSGGWTIEWQGVDGNAIPGATSIYQGIKQALPLGASLEYDLKGEFKGDGKADIGIAVVGEKPYAEGVGDDPLPHLSEEDLLTIKNLRNKCERLIVIVISGRPLDLGAATKDADAVIAAWLPGSEGQGVADVLFGEYPFSGKLPIPWEIGN